ncbi:DUF4150 domain-containing protein [Yoonia sp. F2084L]|uniref:PAAR-like domain-containing protein n=1 Tax=Yoonia sp. F2084L TaxID=2926419 RepID=UPI001FF6BDBB|nr:PAAR-like domain-containing protein [Yoonia sp. F2084L]MCK0097111.1 DUF4150 domain-containing protein [Yoonia sp. F2084L]
MSVFANGREVSGKATPNKVIAAFPSVCLSPPSPPAGPIPIPYPLFTDAGKTGDGTGSVKIKKKEVGKKNGSTYTKSQGNEPATRSFGMDVVSHTISGKNKHQAYSFDVLFEKAGAERFLDLTTTNHGSDPATAAGPNASKPNVAPSHPDPECVTLDGINMASRGRKQPKRRQSGTVASARYKPPGGGTHYFRGQAVKSHTRPWLYRASFSKGLWPDRKKRTTPKGISSRMNDNADCGQHSYSTNPQGGVNHAEAKILEDVLGKHAPGGNLLFKIDWAGNPPVPCCKYCQAMLAAACACFEIELCDENDQSYDWCADQKCG